MKTAMKKSRLQQLKAATIATSIVGLMASGLALADGDMNHGHGKMMNHKGSGHMMDQKQMNQHMQLVTGTGRINKVMGEHMVNISHEPISELNWPKMRMNFQTGESINARALQPGQQVQFMLQVDKENNYLIKEIKVIK